jgi:hypothetical protein
MFLISEYGRALVKFWIRVEGVKRSFDYVLWAYIIWRHLSFKT